MLVRLLILFALLIPVLPAPAAEQTLGQTIKKIFSTPTPTPTPRKKKKTSGAKTSPTPTPSASPKKKPSPSPSSKEAKSPTPSVSPSPKKKKSPPPEEETESPAPKKKKGSPSPSPGESPHRKKKSSPTPEPTSTPEGPSSPTETPSPSPSAEKSPAESPSPGEKKQGVPNATLAPDAIKDFETYPANVQKMIATALELTTRNLTYKYGSADPASGGMDCSGFVFYVLKQNGITDVPRDSSGQYVWLRRAGAFEPVLSQKDDSFELENLKPGDLLFWTGTYAIERDPPITHAMIYLGREKKTGQRVMVGSSDGRVYQGQSRNGVSVFDFKVQRRAKTDEGKLHPTFIGYGHIPKLSE